MLYRGYSIIRIIIALLIMIYIVKKNKKQRKMTGRMRLWAIFSIILIMPVSYSKMHMIFLDPKVLFLTIIILYEVYLKIYVKIRNKNYELETYKDIDTLNREVDFEYNPSILGYLMYQKLELKDLSADILNLYARKIINIKFDEKSKYSIDYGEKYEDYKESLNLGDRYIIKKILETPSKFNFLDWKHRILSIYESYSLSKNKEYISNKKFYIINIAIVILGTIIFKIIFNSIGLGIFISLLLALAFTFCYATIYENGNNKNLKLTAKGEKEIKKCMKLKRFMEEYTLLEDRSVEEICIYESYIPYAVALDVNKKYYGTIFDIFGKEELKNIIEDIDVIEYYNE